MPIYIGSTEITGGKLYIGSTELDNVQVGATEVYKSSIAISLTAPSGWAITNSSQEGAEGDSITNIVLTRTWSGNRVYNGTATVQVASANLPSGLSVSTSHSSGLNNTTTITISGTFPSENLEGAVSISGLGFTQYRYISVSYATSVPSGASSIGFGVSGAINVTHTSGSYSGYIPTTATSMTYYVYAGGISGNGGTNPSRKMFRSYWVGGSANSHSGGNPTGASFGSWSKGTTSASSTSTIGAGTGNLSYSLGIGMTSISTETAQLSVSGGSGGCALNTHFISNYTGVGYGRISSGGATTHASWSLNGLGGVSGCNSSCQGTFVNGTSGSCREPLSNRQCSYIASTGTGTFTYSVAGMTANVSVTNTHAGYCSS